MKLKKSLVFDIILTAIILIGTALLFALGTYFLEDRFNVDDAAALSDPYTSTGGQSIDVIQVENTLSISSGKLAMAAQASPVDGESGVRFASTKAQYIGAATLAKVVYKTLATGIAGAQGASAWFGFNSSDATTAPGFALNAGTCGYSSIGTNLTQFLYWPAETVANAWFMCMTPVVDDTFYLASIIGGHDEGATGITTSTPWRINAGFNLANYNEGNFLYIKKNTGPWLLQGVNPVNSNAIYMPCIGNYNAALEVYDWVTIGNADSAYYPYMQPLHYLSCDPLAGSLYLKVPEVGAVYDSVIGSFGFASNSLGCTATSSSNAIATTNTGDDDVVMQVLTNIDNTTTGRNVYIVLRRNSSNGEHILIGLSTTTDNLQIFSFDGATYTSRGTANVTMTAGATFDLIFGGAVIDSTVVGWYIEGTEIVSLKYTSAANTFYGDGNNNHGIRIPETSTDVKFIRIYAAGNDGEYAGLSNFLNPTSASAAGARRRLVGQ